ncbi:unnamed protein product [Malus baccata var. baccata]
MSMALQLVALASNPLPKVSLVAHRLRPPYIPADQAFPLIPHNSVLIAYISSAGNNLNPIGTKISIPSNFKNPISASSA